MSILEDTNMDNMTVEEARWVSNILHSPRCGLLTRLLCDGIVDADPDGATFLTGLIPRIVQRMTASHTERIGNMRNFVYMLGSQLSADRVKTGLRPGAARASRHSSRRNSRDTSDAPTGSRWRSYTTMRTSRNRPGRSSSTRTGVDR